MQSPLNIEQTVERYNLDEDMKESLIVFDSFIWQDCRIESVEELVAFEKEYQRYDKVFDFCYDNEIGEFGSVEIEDGPLRVLYKGRFQQFSMGVKEDSVGKAFMAAGLTELETLMIKVFRADLSGLFRLDAYYYGVPPVAKSLCEILNSALEKLPPESEPLIRKCNEYDKADFQVGDFFEPGFCLTMSADPTWGDDTSVSLYRITPLDVAHTKARAMYLVNNNTEFQVTFLQDARFRIASINDRGEGKKEIVMEEVLQTSSGIYEQPEARGRVLLDPSKPR